MNLLSASVDWKEGYDNTPELHVTVDAIPHDLVYRQSKVEPSLWVAEQGGFMSFYCWSGTGNDGGFYGREIPVNTPNGPVVLKGPFSSRSSAVNGTEFTECVDAIIHVGRADTIGYAGAVTLDFARKAARSIGVDLLEHYPSWGDPGERMWVPDPRRGPVERCLHCFCRLSYCQGMADKGKRDHEPLVDFDGRVAL